MRLELSKAAQRDIDAIHAYGNTQFETLAADRYMHGLFDLFDLLCLNPEMAVEIKELKRSMRRLRYRSHVAFYRIAKSRILVVRVLHYKQDWRSIL